MVDLRGWCLDFMPAFAHVLFDVAQRTHSQLPPEVGGISFFVQKHHPQGLNFLLRLCRGGKKNAINKRQMLSKAFISLLVNVQRTFASSNRRQSTSRSVSSEGDRPLMLLEVCGILLVKFPDAGAAPKPNDNHRHTINDYRTDAVTS